MSDNNGVDKLDILIDQVGRLTDSLSEFRSDMAEIKGLVREQLTVAQTQAESIKQQMAVSERRASTVEQQAQLVEALIRQ